MLLDYRNSIRGLGPQDISNSHCDLINACERDTYRFLVLQRSFLRYDGNASTYLAAWEQVVSYLFATRAILLSQTRRVPYSPISIRLPMIGNP